MPDEPALPRPLTVRTPDEIAAMTFDESHVIIGPHVLCRGQNACLVGPGGVGKTRMYLQLQVCSIIGRPWIGFPCKPCEFKWLLIQVENDNRRLKHDVLKMRSWCNEEQWAKVNRQLFIHTLESDDDGFLSLDVGRNRQLVAQMIGDIKPGVVGWDALMDFGWGDLNRDVDMFASCSEIGRLTRAGDPLRVPFPIHHALTGREGASKAVGWERAGYGRGSKALHQWARLQINLAPGNETGDIVVVAAGKVSDAKEFPPFAVRLNPETMIYEKDSDFDMRAWRTDVSRKNAPAITDSEVADLCGPDGIDTAELVKQIQTSADCAQATAYRAVERAERRGSIRHIPQSNKFVCVAR